MENSKRITLVMLVVTIIVLLILAGVSINLAVGKNGMIEKAEDTSLKISQGSENTLRDINNVYNKIKGKFNGGAITLEETKQDSMLSKYINTEVKIGSNIITVLAEFKISTESASTIDEEIVITDGVNEFVWVPVSDVKTLCTTADKTLTTETNVKTASYGKLRVSALNLDKYTATTPEITRDVREPDLVTDSDSKSYDESVYSYKTTLGFESAKEMAQFFADDYDGIIQSLEKYGDFYIGRYELSGPSTEPKECSGEVVRSLNWWQMYKACRKVKSTRYVQTTMIWGCQWD